MYDNVGQTKLPLLCQKAAGNITSKPEKNMKLLKDDCILFLSLYIPCQTTAGDLDNFFTHENHSFLVSISEHGNSHKSSKSDFISCLPSFVQPQYKTPAADGIIKDGAHGPDADGIVKDGAHGPHKLS